MRLAPRPILLLTALLACADGIAGSLTITVSNGSTNNLLVTVYDLNASPPLAVMTSALINGNASMTVSLAPDASNQGHLGWTATTQDRDMRSCGRGESARLNDGDSVTVNADSDCSSP